MKITILDRISSPIPEDTRLLIFNSDVTDSDFEFLVSKSFMLTVILVYPNPTHPQVHNIYNLGERNEKLCAGGITLLSPYATSKTVDSWLDYECILFTDSIHLHEEHVKNVSYHISKDMYVVIEDLHERRFK
jgi:hypothetical protein